MEFLFSALYTKPLLPYQPMHYMYLSLCSKRSCNSVKHRWKSFIDIVIRIQICHTDQTQMKYNVKIIQIEKTRFANLLSISFHGGLSDKLYS